MAAAAEETSGGSAREATTRSNMPPLPMRQSLRKPHAHSTNAVCFRPLISRITPTEPAPPSWFPHDQSLPRKTSNPTTAFLESTFGLGRVDTSGTIATGATQRSYIPSLPIRQSASNSDSHRTKAVFRIRSMSRISPSFPAPPSALFNGQCSPLTTFKSLTAFEQSTRFEKEHTRSNFPSIPIRQSFEYPNGHSTNTVCLARSTCLITPTVPIPPS
mmetsp:Transcript_30144/g.79645  ORF Transcript_30144/g.79645 Transcript_30144/m.79645 type:complete len:216 (+) Transcript_30144:188-835(+)